MVSIINTHEYLYSVDNFGDPKVLKDGEAIATVLARLLLLDPGLIQSHPTMGVGLVTKYRYSLDEKITTLRNDFKTQIEKYLPQYQGVEVQAYLKDKQCYITATINDTLYAFFYDTVTGDFNTTFKKLDEL